MKINKKKGMTYLTDATGEVLHYANPLGYLFVLGEKYGYFSSYLRHKRLRINKKILEDNFEIVENFNLLNFMDDGVFKAMSNVYKHKSLDFIIDICVGGSLKEYLEEDDTVEEGFFNIDRIFYQPENGEMERVVEELNNLLEVNCNSSSKISVVLKTMSGFEFKEVAIKPMPVDLDTMYNDDFKETYDHLITTLKSGTKGVALLYGAAGTGKSNLIRHLTKEIPDKRFVFIPVSMVSSLTDPMFLSTLIDNKGSILVLEDCENYIKDRKAGDMNSVVSSILNMTDGILSDVLGIQLICTFNSRIEDIDKALLRRGRLICDYEFKPLEREKAVKLLRSLGQDVTREEPTTLADIFNQAPPSSSNKPNKKLGF